MLKQIITAGLLLMTSMAHATDRDDRVLDIQTYVTPKGIEIWHVEDHSLPIITMNFAFGGVGSILDPDDKVGLGQLVSNSLDEGAGERDATTFQEALQDHAIDLSFNSTRDHFTGKIKTLKRHSDLAFELLYDAIHNPRFDEADVDRMRAANIMRIQSSTAKSNWMGSRLMNDTYFGDHPYARNSGGTISTLKTIAPEDLRNFVKTYFTRERVIVGMAGDVTPDEAMTIVDRIFGDLPEGENTTEGINRVESLSSPVQKSFEMDSPQSVVQMIWSSSISKTDDDYYAYRVMNHLLGGGGFSSFLMDEIREKQGLTYGIYSHPVFMEHDDYIVIESATSPENIKPMTAAIEQVIEMMKTQAVDEKLLSDAKGYLVGALPLRFSTTQSLSGTALRMQLDGRHIHALDEWDEKINAVTAQDVMNVVNKIFASSVPNATTVVGALPDDLGFEVVEIVPGVE